MAIKKWFLLSLLSGVATLAMAYPKVDKQGAVYKGLQDVHTIAQLQGINPQDTTTRWEIGESNLVEWLLAPWDELKVNEALSAYRQEYGSIAQTASTVVNGAIRNNFDASGHLITDEEHQQLLSIIEQTAYLQNFHPQARAITISDTDAQFFPSDVFFTNNLAQPSNVAANQKSSSTLIPRNTPVIVLGQLMAIESAGLAAAEDGWVALWRPEFGLKFTKARHIAFVDEALVDDFPVSTQEPEPGSRLKLTFTSRVRSQGVSQRLPLGTPVYSLSGRYFLAERNQQAPIARQIGPTLLQLYAAQLSPFDLSVDPAGQLDNQVNKVPVRLNYQNYLNQLSNTLLKYPSEYVGPEHNENRYFAFGEGTIGPDGERGMDASTFSLKLIQPFGKWLPRYSVHQVDEGIKTHLIDTTHDATLEENYKAMLDHCQIGNFVSVGPGNNMACLGSISLAQLGQLSDEAYADAVTTGGMTEWDRIPLLALSTVGLTNIEDVVINKPAGTIEIPSTGETLQLYSESKESMAVWYITGKAAVYPVFKSGYLSSYIRDGRSLTLYSYFKPVVPEKTSNPIIKSKL
ncbi:hypothetical protein [Endozoicomonas elysicola]|uniref:Uncharacterized protein n=1 Tax=Endozoicomonas elysicola TaxID=305900 RepID=A0A081KD92_9GAMM|nr:hypothetical protein [Endozoicomonas elysicola]KEI72118.1 hypothetical protein GV64_16515 [Endozoicomonas elysicola]